MSNRVGLRGAFWPQDAWGRVTNAAAPRDSLARPALEAGEEALNFALERFGDGLHSVYLSGAAARGRPGGAAFLILLRLSTEVEASAQGMAAWEAAAANEIRRRHPRLGPCTVSVFRWKDVFTQDSAYSPARFRLAVNSVCLAGRDMSRMLPPQRLDPAVMNGEILGFRQRLSLAAQRLTPGATPFRVRAAARDAGQSVIDAGFALVLESEQVYTEDLDLRRDLFTLNHPSRTRAMAVAYLMTTQPTTDAEAVSSFIAASLRWMGPMTEGWLNANNPQRLARLRA
ncbi:hypothetical protein GC169_08735 [bacterium]|nr:hypothetical protein [bacterium]